MQEIAQQRKQRISIHALLAESDRDTLHTILGGYYFYPRSPCGERQFVFCEGVSLLRISIHALLAESDIKAVVYHYKDMEFLSTLSLRRATRLLLAVRLKSAYFYPRSPCGERPLLSVVTRKNL